MSDKKNQPVKQQGQSHPGNMKPKHMSQNPVEPPNKGQYQEGQTENSSQRGKQSDR
jgi:hypothetical protein